MHLHTHFHGNYYRVLIQMAQDSSQSQTFKYVGDRNSAGKITIRDTRYRTD